MAAAFDGLTYEHSSMESHAMSSQAAYAASKNRLRPSSLQRRSASASDLERMDDTRDNSDSTPRKRRYPRPQSVNFHPNVRLFYAATSDDLEEVEMLIESGMASVNARNPAEGATALHAACFEGNVSCARYLLEHGASVEARDNDGWSPLHAATCGGKRKCVQLLLAADADPFAESFDGYTAFQMAVDLRDERLLDMYFKSFQPLIDNRFIRETNV